MMLSNCVFCVFLDLILCVELTRNLGVEVDVWDSVWQVCFCLKNVSMSWRFCFFEVLIGGFCFFFEMEVWNRKWCGMFERCMQCYVLGIISLDGDGWRQNCYATTIYYAISSRPCVDLQEESLVFYVSVLFWCSFDVWM